ncbi:hypothetical protein CO659_29505 [Rhizobium sp. S9]|nr:hypothetical protein CO659_29505 [Rhizobium sp. S9]
MRFAHRIFFPLNLHSLELWADIRMAPSLKKLRRFRFRPMHKRKQPGFAGPAVFYPPKRKT